VNNLKGEIEKDFKKEKDHLSEELRSYYEEKKEKINTKLENDQNKVEIRKEKRF